LDNQTNAERKTALVARELARYNIDIAALSETRIAGEGKLTEADSGYTFFWKGRQTSEKRQAGVGFAVKSVIAAKLNEYPKAVSDRIITLRLPILNGRFVKLISVYKKQTMFIR
jgi:exonuclease III